MLAVGVRQAMSRFHKETTGAAREVYQPFSNDAGTFVSKAIQHVAHDFWRGVVQAGLVLVLRFHVLVVDGADDVPVDAPEVEACQNVQNANYRIAVRLVPVENCFLGIKMGTTYLTCQREALK